LTYDSAPIALSDKCKYEEYGDSYEIMGYGTRDQHHSAYHREVMGWFKEGDVGEVNQSATVTINTLDSPYNDAGAMALMIPLKNPSSVSKDSQDRPNLHYYIELHQSKDIPNKFNETGTAYQNAIFMRLVAVPEPGKSQSISLLNDTYLEQAGDS
jgi:hypothetical protein